MYTTEQLAKLSPTLRREIDKELAATKPTKVWTTNWEGRVIAHEVIKETPKRYKVTSEWGYESLEKHRVFLDEESALRDAIEDCEHHVSRGLQKMSDLASLYARYTEITGDNSQQLNLFKMIGLVAQELEPAFAVPASDEERQDEGEHERANRQD